MHIWDFFWAGKYRHRYVVYRQDGWIMRLRAPEHRLVKGPPPPYKGARALGCWSTTTVHEDYNKLYEQNAGLRDFTQTNLAAIFCLFVFFALRVKYCKHWRWRETYWGLGVWVWIRLQILNIKRKKTGSHFTQGPLTLRAPGPVPGRPRQ